MSTVAPMRSTTVAFDLRGVLIEWDPRHLYRQLFDEDQPLIPLSVCADPAGGLIGGRLSRAATRQSTLVI